jgi:FdhE protein
MTENDVQALAREYPDWQPWLVVLEAVMCEATDSKWETWVPARAATQDVHVPLLAGVTITVDLGKIRRWQQQLLQTAARSGAPKMFPLNSLQKNTVNTVALFEAALCENGARLKQMADDLGIDPDPFSAVTALIAVPLLHACNRRWALPSQSPGWTAAYCPTCGAWPAFAEMRGIERSRYLRCGRCGAEWQAHGLSCSYCGNTDHKELGYLVPEKTGSIRVIETCNRCRGYLKTFTKLQGSAAPKILLDDLASVDLDIAALEQGFKRPAGPGYALNTKVIAKAGLTERVFGRNV